MTRVFCGTVTDDDGEEWQAWLHYPDPTSDLRKWSRNSKGGRFPISSQITFFDIVDEVVYSERLEAGWVEHLNPLTKTWKAGEMDAGLAKHRKCLKDYWLESNPSLNNSASIATPLPSLDEKKSYPRFKTPVRSRIPQGIASPPSSHGGKQGKPKPRAPTRSDPETPTGRKRVAPHSNTALLTPNSSFESSSPANSFSPWSTTAPTRAGPSSRIDSPPLDLGRDAFWYDTPPRREPHLRRAAPTLFKTHDESEGEDVGTNDDGGLEIYNTATPLPRQKAEVIHLDDSEDDFNGTGSTEINMDPALQDDASSILSDLPSDIFENEDTIFGAVRPPPLADQAENMVIDLTSEDDLPLKKRKTSESQETQAWKEKAAKWDEMLATKSFTEVDDLHKSIFGFLEKVQDNLESVKTYISKGVQAFNLHNFVTHVDEVRILQECGRSVSGQLKDASQPKLMIFDEAVQRGASWQIINIVDATRLSLTYVLVFGRDAYDKDLKSICKVQTWSDMKVQHEGRFRELDLSNLRREITSTLESTISSVERVRQEMEHVLNNLQSKYEIPTPKNQRTFRALMKKSPWTSGDLDEIEKHSERVIGLKIYEKMSTIRIELIEPLEKLVQEMKDRKVVAAEFVRSMEEWVVMVY